MKRSELVSIIAPAVRQCGYSLWQGPWAVAVKMINGFPAAWLAAPTLKSVEGRSRGVMCYKVNMKLMRLSGSMLPEQCAPIMDELQQDAMSIIDILREQDKVCDITAVKCTPMTEPQTPSREVSLTLEMDIHAYFDRTVS